MIRAWWNIRKNKIVHAYAVITILSLISHAHKSLQILYFFNYSIVCINYVGFIYPLSVRVKQHSQGGLMEHVELIKICLMNIRLRKLTIKYVGLVFDFSFAEIWHCITNAFLQKQNFASQSWALLQQLKMTFVPSHRLGNQFSPQWYISYPAAWICGKLTLLGLHYSCQLFGVSIALV